MAPAMTLEQLQAKLEEQQALIDRLQASRNAKLTCKVSEKGAISVYGLGKWPVTLYRSQAERLMAFIGDGHLADFIADNASRLVVKGE